MAYHPTPIFRMSKPLRVNEVETVSESASSSDTEVMSAVEGSESTSVPSAGTAFAERFFNATVVELSANSCSCAVNSVVNGPLTSSASTLISHHLFRNFSLCPATTGVPLPCDTPAPVEDEQSCGVQQIIRRVAAADCASDHYSGVEGKFRSGPGSHSTEGSREIVNKCSESDRSGKFCFRGTILRAVAASSSSSLLRDVHSYSTSTYSRIIRRKYKTKGALFFLEPCRSAAAALLSASATCWARTGEHLLVPAWLALANHLSLLLYLLLFFERFIEIVFHIATCLLPSFVYVLLALLISVLSIPPEIPSESAPPGHGVALEQTLPQQQQRVVRAVTTPYHVSGGSVADSLMFRSTGAGLSFKKQRKYHLVISRRYPGSTAPTGARVPPQYAEGLTLFPAAAEVASPPQLADASRNSSHTRKRIRSNREPTGSPSTRRRSCSTQGKYICRVKEKLWHHATLRGCNTPHAGYASSPDMGGWIESSSLSSAANTNEDGDAPRAPGAAAVVFDTAAASMSASAAAAFEKSGSAIIREAQPVNSAALGGQFFIAREGTGPVLADTIEASLVAPADTAKVALEAGRKTQLEGKASSSLRYAGVYMKHFPTARTIIAGSNSRVPILADVVRDVLQPGPQRGEADQRLYRIATNHADATSAGVASTSQHQAEREEEEKEAERRGSQMWLVALTVAYGYAFLSHVGRGVLLELPMYSFALYLCQLLRLQGLSFSAAPHSTATATEELAARMRAQFLSSRAAERLSDRESGVRSRYRDGGSESNTAATGSSASGSSGIATLTTSIRSNSVRHTVSTQQPSSRPVRRSRSVDSATKVCPEAWSIGMSGLRPREDLAFESPAASSKRISAAYPLSIDAIKATHAGWRNDAFRNLLSPNTLWEAACTRKEYLGVAEDVQLLEKYRKASTFRKEGCCEDGQPLCVSREVSKPPSLPSLDSCYSIQAHRDNCAEDGLRTAVPALPATKGVPPDRTGRAEDTVLTPTETQSHMKKRDVLSRLKTHDGTRLLDELDSRKADGPVLEKGRKGNGHALVRERTVHFLTFRKKKARPSGVHLPEVKKGAETEVSFQVGSRSPQEAVAGARVAAAEIPAGNSHREAARPKDLKVRISKPSNAAQVLSNEDDGVPLKMLETPASATGAGAGPPEQVSASVSAGRNGRAKVAAQDTGLPNVSHVGIVSGTRGCQASSSTVMGRKDNTVPPCQLHVYNSDLGVGGGGGGCSTQTSEIRERYSKAGVTGRPSVARIHKRSVSCSLSPRISKELCRSLTGNDSRDFYFVSSTVKEIAGVVVNYGGHATVERPEVEERSGARFSESFLIKGRWRCSIALLFPFFVKLPGVLWLMLLDISQRCSYYLTALVASRFVQNILVLLSSPEVLLNALHPFHVLGTSPVHFFPSASQRLIFTTCCFWLLRGLHGDIFHEQGISSSDGAQGKGVVPSAASSFFKNMREHRGNAETFSMRSYFSKCTSGNKGSRRERRSPRKKNNNAWRERLIEPDPMPLLRKSASVRGLSSVSVCSAAGRDTLAARALQKKAIVGEPLTSFVEKPLLPISAARGKVKEPRRLWRAAPHRLRRGWDIFTELSRREGLSSYFLLLHAFLLEVFSWAGEFIQPLQQWTAWLALVLLLLLLVSYSLLSLSSTLEILPWQLVHVLVVLRHTSLCTYAACVANEMKSNMQAEQEKSRQRVFGIARRRQDVSIKERKSKQDPRQEARKLPPPEVACTGDHRSNTDNGIDEDKICIFCFEAFLLTDVLRRVNACGHIFHRTSRDTLHTSNNKALQLEKHSFTSAETRF